MEVFLACIVKLDDEGNRMDEFLGTALEGLVAKDIKTARDIVLYRYHEKIKEAGGPDKVEVLIRPFCS